MITMLLGPGWWVLRGFLAVGALSSLLGVSLFASRLMGLVLVQPTIPRPVPTPVLPPGG